MVYYLPFDPSFFRETTHCMQDRLRVHELIPLVLRARAFIIQLTDCVIHAG